MAKPTGFLPLYCWATLAFAYSITALEITEISNNDNACTPVAALSHEDSYLEYRPVDSVFHIEFPMKEIDMYLETLVQTANTSLLYSVTSSVRLPWVDINGNEVTPLATLQTKNKIPKILKEKTDSLKILKKCFALDGVLLRAESEQDIAETKAIISHLGMQNSFVDQFVNESSITRLDDQNEILLIFEDATQFVNQKNKPALVDVDGGYKNPSEDEYSYICLIQTPSTGSLINFDITTLRSNILTLISFLQTLKSKYSPAHLLSHLQSTPSFLPSLSKLGHFVFNLKESAVHLDSSWKDPSPGFERRLRRLASLSDIVVNQHAYEDGIFKIPSLLSMYSRMNNHGVNLLENVYFACLPGNSAILNLPLSQKTQVYRISSFVKDSKVFAYQFLHLSDESFVTNDEMQINDCLPFKDCPLKKSWYCVQGLFDSKDYGSCFQEIDQNKFEARLITCGNDLQVLMVNAGHASVASLDCIGGDFQVDLDPKRTSFLQPCPLKINNHTFNSYHGTVPQPITSPYVQVSALSLSKPAVEGNYWYLVIFTVSVVAGLITGPSLILAIAYLIYKYSKCTKTKSNKPEDIEMTEQEQKKLVPPGPSTQNTLNVFNINTPPSADPSAPVIVPYVPTA
jgi:hypothetical protein